MSDKSTALEDFITIKKEESKLKLKKRKFRAECFHTKKGKRAGNLKPQGENVMKCKNCETVIDYAPYVDQKFEDGIEDLQEAVSTVVNAMHIVKLRAGISGDRHSTELAKQMAQALFTTEQLPAIFKAISENGNKKKKNKKKFEGSVIVTTLHTLGKKSKKSW